jgi:lysophospholipase L1-like esterase
VVFRSSTTLVVLLALALGACGGGSPAGPSGPSGPVPVPGHPVSGVVFYDENGNGLQDSSELVRLPAVTVGVGGRTAQSQAGGRVTVNDVPAGSQSGALRADSLPAHFVAGSPVPIQVPQSQGSEAAFPATLPIGGNRVNVYMAFGDSISAGDGSVDGGGYRGYLEADLRSYWGRATLVNEGVAGTRSDRGEERLGESLNRVRPAYTLILYGTNDWNRIECRTQFPCYTIDAIRSMIGQARAFRSMPIVGTIPPVNAAIVTLAPPERVEWVKQMNDLIRPMVRQEGAALADVHAAMLRETSQTALFSDHVHPSERGYQVIAREFFRAITQPIGSSAASQVTPYTELFALPGL